MANDIERARAVMAAASPGPWHVERTGDCGADIWAGADADAPGCGVARAYAGVTHASSERAHADARAIALAVNTLPALLDVLETANRMMLADDVPSAIKLAAALGRAEAQLRAALR